MVSVEDMARCREQRAARQRALLYDCGGCVLSFTLNIAGAVKTNPLIEKGFDLGLRLIFSSLRYAGFTARGTQILREKTGCEMLCQVEGRALDVKRALCTLEEADDFGRLMDIDVIGKDGVKVSRLDVGLKPRRCLLCDKEAAVCGRSRAHSAESLFQKAEAIMRDRLIADAAERLSALAQKALLFEAAVTPKPGLVDRENNGAHTDMDLFTFLESAAALHGYFASCVRQGAYLQSQAPEQTMERLRFLGRFAEDEMLKATRGVNTHKGALYGLGILLGAAGRMLPNDFSAEALLSAAGEIARREKEALPLHAASGEQTGGVRQFARLGCAGARGQAAGGFPLIGKVGLPALHRALREGMTLNDAAVYTLLCLSAEADDSNVFKRGGEQGQAWLKARAKALAVLPLQKEGVRQLDRDCIRRGLSPGGSADLTAFTLFVYFVTEER